MSLFFFLLIGCGGNGEKEPEPITETENFTYVPIQDEAADENGISLLNEWLKNNPGKKVVSFSGVLAYRDGVSGYIVYFVHGDNSRQRFEQISNATIMENSRSAIFGVNTLQLWKEAKSDLKIVAISTVPSYSGGVREYVICSE